MANLAYTIRDQVVDAATTAYPKMADQAEFVSVIDPRVVKYGDLLDGTEGTAPIAGRTSPIGNLAWTSTVATAAGTTNGVRAVILNGDLDIAMPTDTADNNQARCTIPAGITNGEVMAEFEWGTTGSAGIIFRYAQPGNLYAYIGSTGQVGVRRHNSTSGNGRVGSVAEGPYTGRTLTLIPGSKVRMRVVYDADKVRVYVNDRLEIDATFTTPLTTPAQTDVGVHWSASDHKLLSLYAGPKLA